MDRSGDARAGSWLLVALLVLSVGAFALTRVLRSEDDIVNTVVVSKELTPRGEAEFSFRTTIDEADADVYVVDADTQEPVATLLEGEPLPAGGHSLTWDGRRDDGGVPDEGYYGVRVVLGEEGRDIVPPGAVYVDAPGGAPAVE